MNTTLATGTRHEIPSRHQRPTQHVRRVGIVDRAALHLGVALIKWGRRPTGLPEHERRANRLERALVLREREARVSAEQDAAVLNYALFTLVR